MTTCSQVGGAYAFKDVRKNKNVQTCLRILPCSKQYISNLSNLIVLSTQEKASEKSYSSYNSISGITKSFTFYILIELTYMSNAGILLLVGHKNPQ